jgi:hypothetical protein
LLLGEEENNPKIGAGFCPQKYCANTAAPIAVHLWNYTNIIILTLPKT